MARKDISDFQVCEAYIKSIYTRKEENTELWKYPYTILQEETGQCFKVCWSAMKRAYKRGLIDYGVNLRSGWVTEKGLKLWTEEITKKNKYK